MVLRSCVARAASVSDGDPRCKGRDGTGRTGTYADGEVEREGDAAEVGRGEGDAVLGGEVLDCGDPVGPGDQRSIRLSGGMQVTVSGGDGGVSFSPQQGRNVPKQGRSGMGRWGSPLWRVIDVAGWSVSDSRAKGSVRAGLCGDGKGGREGGAGDVP